MSANYINGTGIIDNAPAKCYTVLMDTGKLRLVTIKHGGEKTDVLLDETYGDSPPAGEYVDDKMLHLHPYFELFFVAENSMRLIAEQSDETYKDSVIILPPGFKHYAVRKEGTYRFFVNVPPKSAVVSRFNAAKAYNAAINDKLRFYIKELYVCLSKNLYVKEEPLLSLILAETAEIFTASEKNRAGVPASGESRYAFLLDKITSDCFKRKITLSYVSEQLYLSEKQTARIIYKCYGTSLSRHIADKKLSAAAMILKNSDKTVSDIINELNYGTECNFYSRFRKKYGCTPLEYRKENRPK